MKKYDCLDRKTQIKGSHFLEASAGTGKTFAIEHLFVRLLIESENPLQIDQILVVTFTKAATRDLRDRIRKNIQNVLQSFQDDFILFDYLHPYFENEEKKIAAQRRLQDALYFYDKCQIFTIHGFCFRMLQEYCYSANVLLEKNIKDFSSIISDEIRSYFYHKADSSSLGKSQLSLLLKKHSSDKILLRKIIRALDDDQNNEDSSLQVSHQDFLDKILKLNSYKTFSFIEAEKAFKEIFPYFKKVRKVDEKELTFVLEKFLKIIENSTCTREDFGILSTSLSLLFLYFSKENQKKKIPESLERNFLYAFILKAQALLSDFLDALNNPSFLIKELAKDLSFHVVHRLKSEDAVSHVDLLKIMLSSLKEKDFVEEVRKRYQAAIIDEFQDTDKLQWNIFEKLFLHNSTLSSLFLVGDPKQAIYRFRKADVYTYLQASSLLGANTKAYLDTNYRSSSHLLNILNQLFSNASSWLSLPKTQSYLPYLPVKASKKEQILLKDTRKAVHFFIKEDPSFKARGPAEETERLIHEKIANEIVMLKENNSLKWNQMAVLVKDRYQSERLKSYLDKRKIPYQSKSHILLGETKAADCLMKVFAAIISPKDTSKVMLAMSTPYFGCDSVRLRNISENEKEKIQFIFHHFHHLLKMKKMNVFISEFLDLIWDKRTILERIIETSSLSFYRETMQILQDLLESYPSYSFSMDGILSYFNDLKDCTGEEEENKLLQPMHDEKGIQILTIHMSKGLEFDIVFVLGAYIRSPVDGDLSKEEIDELDAEKLRQFYVAMTRAKIRVYLPIIIDISNQIISYGSASLNELFFSHLQSSNNNHYERIQNLSKQNIIRPLREMIDKKVISIEELKNEKPIFPTKEEKPTLFPPKKTRPIEKKRYFLSFSSLVDKHEKTLNEDESDKFLFSSHILPTGSDTGVIIHEVFEKIFQMGDLKNSNRLQEIIKDVTALSSLNGKTDIIYKMVEKTLTNPLLPYSFSLQDLDPKKVSTEMEFFFTLPNQNFMKGFIDLVFFHQNKYFIVDWKTNWLGNDDKYYVSHNLQQEIRNNQYDLQAAIYAETLRRYFQWENVDRSQTSFGGAFYVFLRGINSPSNGIYHFYPEMKLLDAVKYEEKVLCLDS